MNVYARGVIARTGTKVRVSDFLARLVEIYPPREEHGESEGTRRLYLDIKGDLIRGCVLTLNDQRRFNKAKLDGNRITVTSEELAKNEHLAVFNFFVLDPRSGRGVYLHHEGSCTHVQLARFLRRDFHVYRNELREKPGLRKERGSDAEEDLFIERVYSPVQAAKILESIRVSRFQHDIHTVRHRVGGMRPAQARLRHKREVLYFDSQVEQPAGLKTWLGRFIRRPASAGKVFYRQGGVERMLDLVQPDEPLASWHYDAVAVKNMAIAQPFKQPMALAAEETFEQFKALFSVAP